MAERVDKQRTLGKTEDKIRLVADLAISERLTFMTMVHRLLSYLGNPRLPHAVVQLGCEVLSADRGALYLLDQNQKVVLNAQYPDVVPDPDDQDTDALDEARLSWHTLHDFLPQLVDCAHDSEARFHYCAGGDCWLTLSVPLQWEGQNIAVVQLSYNPNVAVDQTSILGLVYAYAELAALALVQHWRYRDPAHMQVVRPPFTDAHSFTSGVSLALATSEAERARIASDLHDGVRSALLGMQLHLEALRVACMQGDISAAQQHLGRSQAALDAIDQELSHIVRDLYPPQVGEADVPTVLVNLGERWSAATKIPVEYVFDPNLPVFETAQVVALYRIVQEALSNCNRHAQASRVTIRLTYADDHVLLMIADNGRGGANLRGGGIGLLSMAQRAHAIGASFHIDSPPDQGTRIEVKLPLRRREPDVHVCSGDCHKGADE
ncbi:sensor histidine kinase [Chloroflexus sp.]|uniref:sensor histidine kinase n=1 Tax=Chloroflexus sp. TaxID=1904827 RepID=UPI002ADE099C|nr:sensor histidine kinase [Chloroflexus sp.]